MSTKNTYGFNGMDVVISNDEGKLYVKVTDLQLTILQSIQDDWFEFLKICNSKELSSIDDKLQAVKVVMQAGLGVLGFMTKEQVNALPPKWRN